MKSNKIISIFIIVVLASSISQAQKLKNYGEGGKKKRSTTDFLKISGGDEEGKIAPALVVALFGAGLGVYKTVEDKKQQSYVGTYSNSVSLKKLPKQLVLERYLLFDNNIHAYAYKAELAEKFRFEINEDDTDQITIKLNEAQLTYSKACFKGTERLAITFNFKMSGISSKDGARIDLGESNVVVPIVYVRNDPFDFTGPNLKEYVSIAYFSKHALDNNRPVSFSVTAREVNLDHLEPSLIEQILKSNGSDITGIMKAALGVK